MYRFLPILFLFFNTLVSAQNTFIVKGVLLNQDKKAIIEATVLLVKGADKQVIVSGFSEDNGQFSLTHSVADSVFIVVQQSNYTSYQSETFILSSTEAEKDLGTIMLSATSNQLDNVTVVAKKPYVERKADRSIVHPEALISNAGANALDALGKAPGVMIDQDGTIKLKGKPGVLILIDNKPTYLTGEELANYLKSLPADAIKQFELMTNPPANYDAAGSSGIINVITKKTIKGINGSVSTNYSQGRYARTNNNAMLSIQRKKLAIFTNLGASVSNSFHDLYIERQYRDALGNVQSAFNQNSYIRPHSESFNGRVGIDYYASDKTTIGVLAKGVSMYSHVQTNNTAERTDANSAIINTILAKNQEHTKMINGSYNLNLRHQFDSTGKNITFDLDYVNYQTRIAQSYENFFYDPTNALVYSDLQEGALPSKISIYAFKSDYSQPFQSGGRFEAGVKSSITQTNNQAIYDLTTAGVTNPNYDLSNHFLYDEWINAAYLNYSKTFKRLEIQSGLRLEVTSLKGNQLGNPTKPASKFDKYYASLFPTLFMSYALDSASKHTLSFSYGRRINRPFYRDLNPFSSPLDKFTFYEGNPYLQPTFGNNLSLSYGFNNLFSTTLSYNNNQNQIQETIEIKKGIYYSRPGNIGFSETWNLSAEAGIPVNKWLTTSLYSEAQYGFYKSNLYTQQLRSRGTYWYININNNFALKKGWSMELSGEYITNFIDSQFKFGDYGHASFGFQKKIFKDKGSFRFNISDILFTNKIRGRINNLENTTANWYGPRDTRVCSFTLRYGFGKSGGKKQRTSFGSEAEQNRVK